MVLYERQKHISLKEIREKIAVNKDCFWHMHGNSPDWELTHYQFHYFNWCNKVDSSSKRKGISLIKIFVEILFQTEKSTLTEQ